MRGRVKPTQEYIAGLKVTEGGLLELVVLIPKRKLRVMLFQQAEPVVCRTLDETTQKTKTTKLTSSVLQGCGVRIL